MTHLFAASFFSFARARTAPPRPPAAPPVAARPALRPDRDRDAMLAALNASRTAAGLRPLVLDPTLCAVASAHASELAGGSGFSHDSADGSTPFDRLRRAGVRYGYAGENMAEDDGAARAESALMRSPAHRGNIMDGHYARVGVSAVRTSEGTIFVQDFTD